MKNSDRSPTPDQDHPTSPPVAPISLRLACLKAAEHQIQAERALMAPWKRARLAPIPPGARWQGGDDPFPQLYPLGSWGNLVAALRQDVDTMLLLAAGPTERLWTARDSQAADSQCAGGWRDDSTTHATETGGTAVESTTRRLVALGGAAQLVEIWHRLLDFSGDELNADVLASLSSLTMELLTLGRAPGHRQAEDLSDSGIAFPSTRAAERGALRLPGSGASIPTPEPGSFSNHQD